MPAWRARTAVALGAALLPILWASAQDDAALQKAVAAIDRKDPQEAIRLLEGARTLAPRRADIAYQLARAYELAGRAGDAVRYFAEAARLDPKGLGSAAQADEERLRARSLRVELESGEENLAARRFGQARADFERAFELADRKHRLEGTKAREGYAQAAAGELAVAALGTGTRTAKVRLLPITGSGDRGELADMVELLHGHVLNALRAEGAVLLGSGSPGQPDLIVRGTAGQRIVLSVDGGGAGGAPVARLSFRALVNDKGTEDLPPETVTLELSIDAERDDPARPGQPTRLPVTEGSELKSGDRFRIRARTNRDAHVYAFIFDSKGSATLLFPGTERLFPALASAGIRGTNPIKGLTDVLVPPLPASGNAYWFFLDENTGTETFYVAASLAPLDDVEALLKELDAQGEAGRVASDKVAKAIVDRASATKILGDGESIQGRGAVVRYISVKHR